MPERRLSRSRERRARRDLALVEACLLRGEWVLALEAAERGLRWLHRPGADPEAASARRLTRIFEALVRLTLRRAVAALAEAPRPAERAA